MDARTVGLVADLTRVSVRTLHHYDHIGSVVPSVRTPAGYRCYTDAEPGLARYVHDLIAAAIGR